MNYQKIIKIFMIINLIKTKYNNNTYLNNSKLLGNQQVFDLYK